MFEIDWKGNTQAKVCRIIIMEETTYVKTWHKNLIQGQWDSPKNTSKQKGNNLLHS